MRTENVKTVMQAIHLADIEGLKEVSISLKDLKDLSRYIKALEQSTKQLDASLHSVSLKLSSVTLEALKTPPQIKPLSRYY